MRYLSKPLGYLFFILPGALLLGAAGPTAAAPPSPFVCTLEIEREFPAGAPVNLRFSLKNRSSAVLYVLTWYTPLEGPAGDIFTITRNCKEKAPYRGIAAKRGQPAAGDYAAVEPGKTITAKIDLAAAYDLAKTGQYHVEFAGKLFDVVDKKKLIPRQQADHKMQTIACNSVDFEIVGGAAPNTVD